MSQYTTIYRLINRRRSAHFTAAAVALEKIHAEKELQAWAVTNKLVIHQRPKRERCWHDWASNQEGDPDHCSKCGMSFTQYVFMECP